MLDRIVVITKKTVLEELVERHNSRAQARFYIEHSTDQGGDFAPYQASHEAYVAALDGLRRSVPGGVRTQFIERFEQNNIYLPPNIFGFRDNLF